MALRIDKSSGCWLKKGMGSSSPLGIPAPPPSSALSPAINASTNPNFLWTSGASSNSRGRVGSLRIPFSQPKVYYFWTNLSFVVVFNLNLVVLPKIWFLLMNHYQGLFFFMYCYSGTRKFGGMELVMEHLCLVLMRRLKFLLNLSLLLKVQTLFLSQNTSQVLILIIFRWIIQLWNSSDVEEYLYILFDC